LAALLLAASQAWADRAQEEKEPARAEEPKKKQIRVEEPQEKEQPSKLFRALGWGVYGASAADLICTEIALSRGAYEANPFMRNRAVRISYHVAFPILINYATEKDRKNGDDKRALWVRIAFVAAYAVITTQNLRQGGGP